MGYTAASYVELKSQANDLASTLISFDKPPTTAADVRLLDAVRLLQPIAVDHTRLTRVGGEGDGGYVMLAGGPASVAVSIGVGPDVSWDSAVASKGTPVHMFDHTVRRLPGVVPGGTFHRLGVGPIDEGPLRTLSSIMELAGVSLGLPAQLKMDVEGAEWSSLAACRPGLLGAFDQIVMELHDLDRLLDADSGSEVLTALAAARRRAPADPHPREQLRTSRPLRHLLVPQGGRGLVGASAPPDRSCARGVAGQRPGQALRSAGDGHRSLRHHPDPLRTAGSPPPA